MTTKTTELQPPQDGFRGAAVKGREPLTSVCCPSLLWMARLG
jgi:hypothetical protein